MDASLDACEVITKLGSWNDETWGDLHGNYYCFSPEWNKVVEQRYREYDELEKRRIVAMIPRLPWQQSREDERTDNVRVEKTSYMPMKESLWRICPLWVHLRRYLERPEYTCHPQQSWDTVLPDWDQFVRQYDSDESFRKSLSPIQRASYKILRAWLAAAYIDASLPQAAQSYIVQQTGTPSEKSPVQKEELLSATSTLNSQSLYHSYCFALFLSEFHPRTWEPYMTVLTFTRLQNYRFHASIQAIAQKLSYATLYPGPPPQVQTWAYSSIALNDHLIRDELPRAWAPYYLFSTEHMETITVSSLPRTPEYVCVSHTWGRWRTGSDVAIPGVPWKVPQNSLYDVQELPRHLARLGFPYVWFDLFCIPQNGSKRGQLEIANQARIFRGSKTCIAWINDVESWDPLLCALDWLALRYLRVTSRIEIPNYEERLERAASKAASPLGDLIREKTNKAEPSSWFSSLWTLQESVLCPDLELYTKEWQRLEDRRGQAIPLRPLIMFVQVSFDYCKPSRPLDIPLGCPNSYRNGFIGHPKANANEIPNAVRQTVDLDALSGLGNVFVAGSPATLLANANIRQSTGDRAPAIMSALGVTEWHRRHLERRWKMKRRARLVMGLYPIEFVRETANKYGYLFWETLGHVPSSEVVSIRGVLLDRHSLGSMLPFSRNHGRDAHMIDSFTAPNVGVREHEAVATWKVRSDGSVRMSQAGIFATSENPMPQGLTGAMYVRGESVAISDFQGRLEQVAQSGCVYAVVLYGDLVVQCGLLLQKLRYNILGRQYLIKIGIYYFTNAPPPVTRQVNWVVV
ncbi:hypothetical protein GGR52DRAFT_486477 [Hypoxylon sp. FL1284]|nr:hypothetical protein GGR52DRAFT_486477 [Hypoxylon sp. FL1284]